jgi:short-subunit dehydrogenase
MNVVITGASSGIGQALAKTFALHGQPILAAARREERLFSIKYEMESLGGAVIHPLALDITSEGAAEDLFRKAVQTFGKVHVLINNAGMGPYQEFCEMKIEDIRKTISLNVNALTELCHSFLPHMLAHGEPSHLVNVGSVGSFAPLPNFSVYTGSKHYVRVFTDLLYHECRGTNVRISALHPGGVLTEFPKLAGQQITKFGQKRMMTSEQVAEKAYPAILQGRRVIIPGGINKLAVLIGKFFPFPLAIQVTSLIYKFNVSKTEPTYFQKDHD